VFQNTSLEVIEKVVKICTTKKLPLYDYEVNASKGTSSMNVINSDSVEIFLHNNLSKSTVIKQDTVTMSIEPGEKLIPNNMYSKQSNDQEFKDFLTKVPDFNPNVYIKLPQHAYTVAKKLRESDNKTAAAKSITTITPFSIRDYYLMQKEIANEKSEKGRHFPGMNEVWQHTLKDSRWDGNQSHNKTVADVFRLNKNDKRMKQLEYKQRVGSAGLATPAMTLKVAYKKNDQNKLEYQSDKQKWLDVDVINAYGVEIRGLSREIYSKDKNELKKVWTKHFEDQFRGIIHHAILKGKKYVFIPPFGNGVFIDYGVAKDEMIHIIRDSFNKVMNEFNFSNFGMTVYANKFFQTINYRTRDDIVYLNADLAHLITDPDYQKYAKDIVIVNAADGEQTRVNSSLANYEKNGMYKYLGQCIDGHSSDMIVPKTVDECLAAVTTLGGVKIAGNTSAIDYNKIRAFSKQENKEPARITSKGVVSHRDLDSIATAIVNLTAKLKIKTPFSQMSLSNETIEQKITQLILIVGCFASRNGGTKDIVNFDSAMLKAFDLKDGKNALQEKKDSFGADVVTLENFQTISGMFQKECACLDLHTYNPEVIKRELNGSTVAQPTAKTEWEEGDKIYKKVGFRTKHMLNMLSGQAFADEKNEDRQISTNLVRKLSSAVEAKLEAAAVAAA
jgi:hypothetical protein